MRECEVVSNQGTLRPPFHFHPPDTTAKLLHESLKQIMTKKPELKFHSLLFLVFAFWQVAGNSRLGVRSAGRKRAKTADGTCWGESNEEPFTQINLCVPGWSERSEQSHKHIRQDLCRIPPLRKVKRLRGACRGSSDCNCTSIASIGGLWNPNRVNEHLRVPHKQKVQTTFYSCLHFKQQMALRNSYTELS